jgi:hypothetical protein
MALIFDRGGSIVSGVFVQFLFADHTFDTDARDLRRGDTPIPVQPLVFDLLTYLLQNHDRVVSKHDLLGAVWAGRSKYWVKIKNRKHPAMSRVMEAFA